MDATVRMYSECSELANGTSLRGYFPAGTNYWDLVEVFGEPSEGCDKSDAEWVGEISFGEDECYVFTIYNYKDGINYCGSAGSRVEDITDWHIGGHYAVANLLVDYFNYKLKNKTEV